LKLSVFLLLVQSSSLLFNVLHVTVLYLICDNVIIVSDFIYSPYSSYFFMATFQTHCIIFSSCYNIKKSIFLIHVRGVWRWTKGETTIYKRLNRKLKIELHEPHLKQLYIRCLKVSDWLIVVNAKCTVIQLYFDKNKLL
jgi:hypothetical protein